MLKSVTRVLKAGWLSFTRNRWLSLTSVLVMILTLLSVNSLLFLNIVSASLLKNLQDKIDISVYFKPDASETEILKVRDDLKNLSEVKNVDYVSRDEALAIFKEKHKDNPVFEESLKELGNNPLPATLNIRANVLSNVDVSVFESIAKFLEKDEYKKSIEKVNYNQNKEAIAKFSSFSRTAQKSALLLTLILAVVAGLVAFNTVRLTMYSWREEISVMRLVGATNWFIRGPFLVEGILYGVFAAICATILMVPILLYLSPKVSAYLGFKLIDFFKANLGQIILYQLLAGIILGGVSSFIAIRRYLKV